MSKSQVNCIGLSHHHAPVEVRERLKFIVSDLTDELKAANAGTGADRRKYDIIREMVLLSTCNRVELYACVDANESESRRILFELMGRACRRARQRCEWEPAEDVRATTSDSISNAVFHLRGTSAVEHLFRIATGLDSMVLGETQILTQIGEAYDTSREARIAGPVLTEIFRVARRTGKRARTETAISSNPGSISTVAVSVARTHSGGLKDRDVTVVGLGEMGKLVIKLMLNRGVSRLRIVNRSYDRAKAMAIDLSRGDDLECTAHALDELPEILGQTDIVVTATSATDWIIDAEMVRAAVARRMGGELVLVDIAVPRNIASGVRDVDGVVLADLDDIQSICDTAQEARRREIPKVESLIAREMHRLDDALRKLKTQPLIRDLRRKAERIRQLEIQRLYEQIGKPDAATCEHVQRMTRALVNKLLHEPTARLEELATHEDHTTYEDTVRELFELADTADSDGCPWRP